MNNPNPFVPKGSLLDQQSQRRSRLKLAVFCVLAVCVTGLVAMLIQGCKRDVPPTDSSLTMTDTNTPSVDTNAPPTDTNTAVVIPPPMTNPPVVVPPPVVEPAASTEYVVVAGDALSKIAKKNGVGLKALEDANPGVDSKKLKIKQKLNIPASTQSAAATGTAVSTGADMSGGETYVVKSGDTLSKIAKAHGISVKNLEAANNLTTTKIKVGQKLKIPAKADSATAAPAAPAAAAPDMTSAPVPATPATPTDSTPAK